ncbi:MAG TPA: hypothetical protein DCG34_10315 [Clostridiales bacterium]|jgi:methylamine--corrinoid protein Co-methyltransferase|nr:hypothetical protein [Clostridiales bacterium]
MLDMFELYKKSLEGQFVEEKVFDNRTLPNKLNELAKEYDIAFNSAEIVPQDSTLVDAIYKAALDLIIDVGIYNISTNTVLKFDEYELKSQIKLLHGEHTYGSGNDKVHVKQRKMEDKRSPVVFGGANGGAVNEEYYSKVMESAAKEPSLSGIHTGGLVTLRGMEIKARTPIELLAARAEALWTREGMQLAGRPGMPMVGIMSSVTGEGQIFGDGLNGMRPEDMHLLCLLNDMKLDWDTLKKTVNTSQNGYTPEACMCPVMGGYTGGPATTTIACVAEALVGYMIFGADCYSLCPPFNPMTGEGTSPQATFVNAHVGAALKRNTQGLYSVYTFPSAGMCTEMMIEETAVFAGACTVSGVDVIFGAAARCGAEADVYSGMSGRITAEIARASAQLSASDMNEFCVDLAKTYTDAITSGKVPEGKKFHECYDLKTVRPSEEFENLWVKSRTKLTDMGLDFE